MTSRYVLKIHPSILEQTTESGGEEITCQVGPDSLEWSEKFLAATLLCKSSCYGGEYKMVKRPPTI